jgi:PAS domain S-box-containing protein
METATRLGQAALDNFEQAVIKLDAIGRCVYANRAAARLLASENAIGWLMPELFPDPEEARKIREEMKKRLRGEASAYTTEFTRPADGKKIPVSIYAFPVLNTADRVTGTMAIVGDMRVPQAQKQMHAAIESCRDSWGLLSRVAGELASVLPFDEFRVTTLSGDRQHLRTLFSSVPEHAQKYPFKWWPMPPFVASLVEDDTPRIYDVAELFQRPDFRAMAESDPLTAAYRDTVISTVSVPVVSGDRTIAFVSADSRGAPYTEADLALCDKLPFSEAVNMALHLEEEKALKACLTAIRQMGAAQAGAQGVAQVLVELLAANFGWEHIAVFQRDEERGAFFVLAQASATGSVLDEEFTLGDDAIVAQCFRQQDTVNVPDVHATSLPVGTRYVQGVPGIRSELALPIPGAQAQWVLNVESSLRQAFAKEEIELLQPLLMDAGHILEQIQLAEVQAAVLDGISDAVIETNRTGVIRAVNPAARALLGATSDAELIGTQLASFLQEGEPVRELIDTGQRFSGRELWLVRQDKRAVPVLLSGSDLKQGSGRRVFFASDLTYQEEVERSGMLKDVFRHASLECRVPLALASGWLDRLVENQSELEPEIDKVLEQIRKADMPLERLLRVAESAPAGATAPLATDLRQVVQDVLEQLPLSERTLVDDMLPTSPLRVRGADDDLRFCVETTLSFAFRTKPLNGRVKLEMQERDQRATLRVAGDWTPSLGSDTTPSIRRRWRRTAAADLALAEEVLQDIASRADGQFRARLDGELRLELELPVVEGA